MFESDKFYTNYLLRRTYYLIAQKTQTITDVNLRIGNTYVLEELRKIFMLRFDVSLRNHLFCRASYLDLAKPKSGAAKLFFFLERGMFLILLMKIIFHMMQILDDLADMRLIASAELYNSVMMKIGALFHGQISGEPTKIQKM